MSQFIPKRKRIFLYELSSFPVNGNSMPLTSMNRVSFQCKCQNLSFYQITSQEYEHSIQASVVIIRETNYEEKVSISTCTAPATTMHTLNNFLLPQVLGNPAHACCRKVVISRLHASQTAQTFITRLHNSSSLSKTRIEHIQGRNGATLQIETLWKNIYKLQSMTSIGNLKWQIILPTIHNMRFLILVHSKSCKLLNMYIHPNSSFL